MRKRFENKISKDLETGCWLWIAATTRDGYGSFSVGGKKRRAHRIAWLIYKDQDPGKLQVLHECDNPLCVNPDHLFLGTHQDNVDDKMKKNRYKKPPSGDNHWTKKFPERRATGERHRSRTKPESIAKGDSHWTRKLKFRSMLQGK